MAQTGFFDPDYRWTERGPGVTTEEPNTGQHKVGELFIHSNGDAWRCVKAKEDIAAFSAVEIEGDGSAMGTSNAGTLSLPVGVVNKTAFKNAELGFVQVYGQANVRTAAGVGANDALGRSANKGQLAALGNSARTANGLNGVVATGARVAAGTNPVSLNFPSKV